MGLIRTLIGVLAVLRLTRFVTSDWLGEWWLVAPAKRWAADAELDYRTAVHTTTQEFRKIPLSEIADPAMFDRIVAEREATLTSDAPLSWQARLVKGLDCPFCVGFWLGAAVLLGSLTVGRAPLLGQVWRFVLTALGLNYVVGHVSARLDS